MNVHIPLYMRIFEHRDIHTTGYQFTAPGVMISGVDLPLDYDRQTHEWVIRQPYTEGSDRYWEARGEDQITTILTLIAMRMCNKTAVFTDLPEEEDPDG